MAYSSARRALEDRVGLTASNVVLAGLGVDPRTTSVSHCLAHARPTAVVSAPPQTLIGLTDATHARAMISGRVQTAAVLPTAKVM